MKVLLVYPAVEAGKVNPAFPLGLGYIASVLIGAGHEVRALDLNAHYDWPPSVVENQIAETEYDVMGITGKISDFASIRWLVQVSKTHHSNAKVVVGGPLASAAPHVILKGTQTDIAVVGEGEIVVVELLQAFQGEKGLEAVHGISYRKDEIIVDTPPQGILVDLEKLPFPAWHLFPMKFYIHTPRAPFRRIPHMSMITSRGCPYACAFCSHAVFGRRFRPRSVENIVEEIQALQVNYGVRGISFEDDAFTLRKDRVHALCDELIRRRPGVFWTCTGRTDSTDRDLLEHMKAAGCVSISLGIESGSQVILDEIGKRTKVENNRAVLKLVWEVGLVPRPFMMLGMPSETEETLRQSVEFCKDVGSFAEWSIATPVPGTPLWAMARAMGRVGSELALVESWQHWFEGVVVNLTKMPDAELINAKKQAEKEILNHIVTRHWRHLLTMLGMFIRVNGATEFWVRLINFLRLLLRANRGGGMGGRRCTS